MKKETLDRLNKLFDRVKVKQLEYLENLKESESCQKALPDKQCRCNTAPILYKNLSLLLTLPLFQSSSDLPIEDIK